MQCYGSVALDFDVGAEGLKSECIFSHAEGAGSCVMRSENRFVRLCANDHDGQGMCLHQAKSINQYDS